MSYRGKRTCFAQFLVRCFVSAGLMKFQRGELAHLSGNFSRHLSGEAASSGSSASGWHLQNMNEDILYLQNRTLIYLFCKTFSGITRAVSLCSVLSWLSFRPISKCQLNTLLCLHLTPIYLVVFKGSHPVVSHSWISHLEGGFTLRCLQRLSLPDLATLP